MATFGFSVLRSACVGIAARAEQLRCVARDEQIVRDARSRLTRWRSQGKIDPRYARAWEEILAMTPAQIAQTIAADTPRMRDLRQNSPFAGALNEPERRRVLAAVHEMAT